MHKYVHLVDLVKSFLMSIHYLVFTFKNRLRYNRDRASQRLAVIQFIFSIHSLGRLLLVRLDLRRICATADGGWPCGTGLACVTGRSRERDAPWRGRGEGGRYAGSSRSRGPCPSRGAWDAEG